MIKLFVNAWKAKEVRNKILYTFLILAIIRLGVHVALPGIDVQSILATESSASTGTLYNIIAGGANSRWSIFSLGIGPYINAAIIMQLLTVAIPKIEQLNKEGEEGRKKIENYTRYLTVALALIQAIGVTYSYRSVFSANSIVIFTISVICLVCGATFIMWLAEQITDRGITNGSSMIIFVNIVSNLPSGVRSLTLYGAGGDYSGVIKVIIILVLLLADILFIVFINEGERRIPVQYSSKMMGRRSFGGQSTFMPIKISTSGVLAIIFAISILQFPETIGQFVHVGSVFQKVIDVLRITNPIGTLIYIVLIFFFSYFYTSIIINPNEMAENMKKSGGFIPGIRPGQPTSAYIDRVVNRVTFIGAISFVLIALVPLVLQWVFGLNVGFGGTTLIIVVGVALDIVKAMESQLLMRHYKGFLND
ncbi:MAG: preprotein translocase subunit SecY [Clostridia bacterium]|nr:preprotein translocase subunit SecY [Clostridia bacterium]MCI2000622.1 preprotein translocase subunit SecY [Clostridia bacterium]MCI2015305.1 preprotein translocase subunit SecY [Clostridia bacterium]